MRVRLRLRLRLRLRVRVLEHAGHPLGEREGEKTPTGCEARQAQGERRWR